MSMKGLPHDATRSHPYYVVNGCSRFVVGHGPRHAARDVWLSLVSRPHASQTDAFWANMITVTYRQLAEVIPDASWAQWAARLAPTIAVEAIIAWLDLGQPDREQVAGQLREVLAGVIRAAQSQCSALHTRCACDQWVDEEHLPIGRVSHHRAVPLATVQQATLDGHVIPVAIHLLL